MALTHVATSAPVFTQGTVTPTVPAGLAEGDHVFLYVTAKWIARTPDPASYVGWTLLADELVQNSTAGNTTAGQGQVRITVLHRRVPAGGLVAPDVSFTASGTVNAGQQISSATISGWRSDTGAALNFAYTVGYDTTTVTAYNTIALANPGLDQGDLVLLFTALTDDAPGWNTFNLAATGATFSAVTELADAGSALGDDTRVGIHSGSVLTGPSTDVPRFFGNNTGGAGTVGGTIFLRAREVTSTTTPSSLVAWAAINGVLVQATIVPA